MQNLRLDRLPGDQQTYSEKHASPEGDGKWLE